MSIAYGWSAFTGEDEAYAIRIGVSAFRLVVSKANEQSTRLLFIEKHANKTGIEVYHV